MDQAKESAGDKIKAFLKKNVVMVIAFIAAAVSAIFVPVDKEYLHYIDYKTLTCLFCVLAVVCALRRINFFYMLARKVVQMFKTAQASILALVYITFIGSMLIANDMALLTFLPLGFFVLTTTHKEKYMAFTFIMQNIAANLGGMLTPFGNPQNLYLYTKFSIPTKEFILIMTPPFLLSVVLFSVCCLIFVKRDEPLHLEDETLKLPIARALIYLALFALAIVIVFRGVPYWIGLIVIPAALLILDPKALKMVDYPLLLTFVFFFIFSNNMSRIDVIREFMSGLMQKNTLLFSTLSCQIISNVPSAILLSQFTSNYPALLVGVNIGGVGTLIASLASLITFREYTKLNPGKTREYIAQFSAFNFSFLIILLLFMHFLLPLLQKLLD
ncbi:MAG: citrate transporter [Clostridia bacterium]|nr:citrate transporter [Clostridia bacterium]